MSSRARYLFTAFGVDQQLAVDGVADVALQRTDRFLLRLSLGDLALEVGASVRPRLADLADGGHVDGVVELPVAASRHPVHDAAARRELDRCRAVVGGEGVPAGEAAGVAGVADDLARDDRADAVEVGERGPRGFDRDRDPAVGLLQLRVEPADVLQSSRASS